LKKQVKINVTDTLLSSMQAVISEFSLRIWKLDDKPNFSALFFSMQ